MNRTALSHEAKRLGKRIADPGSPAASRLPEIEIPVLIIVGAHDIPFMHAAADYMMENLRTAHKVIIPDAAHLANMDQPELFQHAVREFLE